MHESATEHVNMASRRTDLEGKAAVLVRWPEDYKSLIVRRILHKHRALWYKIGLHLPGVQTSDLDAIKEEDSSNCEVCSKKLTELWLKQVDPPPSKEALDRAIKKAQQWPRSTILLATSTIVALVSVAIAVYYHLTFTPLLHESLPTNVMMFGREDDLKNLTKLWMDKKVQFINVYGPPGWGKSTLVMRFGHQVVEGGVHQHERHLQVFSAAEKLA